TTASSAIQKARGRVTPQCGTLGGGESKSCALTEGRRRHNAGVAARTHLTIVCRRVPPCPILHSHNVPPSSRSRRTCAHAPAVHRERNSAEGRAVMNRLFLTPPSLLAPPMAPLAHAADLSPAKAPPMAAPLPVYNWTGIYLGINGGGAWGRQDPLNIITDRFDAFNID